MKNVLIIGCGLLGSSLVKRIAKKKLAKKIFIFEKSKKNISKIKRLKLPGTLVNKLQEVVAKSNLIIFCTPMSEYKKMILRLNNNFNSKQIITDVGSYGRSNFVKSLALFCKTFIEAPTPHSIE